MDIQMFYAHVEQALRTYGDKAHYIAQTAGGWEIWLQCELAYSLQHTECIREVDVWGNGNACDFYFDSTKLVVELKAIGWNRVLTSQAQGGSLQSMAGAQAAFAAKVIADQAKLQTARTAQHTAPGYISTNPVAPVPMPGPGLSVAVLLVLPSPLNGVKNALVAAGYNIVPATPQFDIAHWWC